MYNNEVLAQIARLMCENGLTLNQVGKYLEKSVPVEQQFDVAVILDGKVCRLPLIVAEEMDPMGIYPFKYGPYSEYYIELTEQNGIVRKEAVSHCKDQQELPSLEFWRNLETVLPQLNEALTRLHGIPISGSYYAMYHNDPRNFFWTVRQGESIHDHSVLARIRYIVKM